ncbi:hypothetical protein VTJ04DRAFT_10067 [Mycothermus thermophilus]|uniref:uncharacterized protein n=1 Tax=Humicola insolens TaxID=85995 RepID=UPI003743F6BB
MYSLAPSVRLCGWLAYMLSTQLHTIPDAVGRPEVSTRGSAGVRGGADKCRRVRAEGGPRSPDQSSTASERIS